MRTLPFGNRSSQMQAKPEIALPPLLPKPPTTCSCRCRSERACSATICGWRRTQIKALEEVLFCSSDSLGGVLAHLPLWRVTGVGARGTHSLALFIVLLVSCIVSLIIISLFIIRSEQGGGNVGDGWHAQRVGAAWASRAAEVASAFPKRVRARCVSSGPASGQPVASGQASDPAFDVQACVVV